MFYGVPAFKFFFRGKEMETDPAARCLFSFPSETVFLFLRNPGIRREKSQSKFGQAGGHRRRSERLEERNKGDC